MKNILNRLKENILVINDDGKIKFCNSTLLSKLKYEAKEIIELHIDKIIVEDKFTIDKVISDLDSYIGKDITFNFFSKDKEEILVCGEMVVEKWDGNDTIFIISRDINKESCEKANVKKIIDVKNQMQYFLETSVDFMALIGADGKYKKVNSGWTEILGWTEEELLSMNWKELVHENDLESTLKYERLKKVTKVPMELTNRYRCKNGEYRWLKWNSNCIKLNEGYIFTAKDITNEKRLKEQKLAYDEIIHLDNIRSEFFSNISHEFKTPLNIILTTMQLINQKIENNSIQVNDDTKLNKYMKLIKQNSYRLLRLVNNVIDMSKIETGYYEIHLENHNIVSVVENITMSVAQYVEDKGIDLIFDTDSEEEIIACDPDKIERIMLNLLSNAIKYTGKNGEIDVNLNVNNNNVIITVKDNGIGISEEKLNSIFDRYAQVDNIVTRKSQGSGIGLSLVKSLVEMHNGRIYAKSYPDEGTEFTVEIPMKVLNSDDKAKKYDDLTSSRVEKCNIEFADIYDSI